MVLENIISTFDLINNLVGAGMFFVGLFSLGKAVAHSIRGIAGHESTQAAGEHVRRWGRNLRKLDQRTREYNRLANRLAVDMKRGDLEIEHKLQKIKEYLQELKAIDENPNLARETRGGI